MSASPNWTEEELNLLREVYPKLGKCEELSKYFPTRKLSAICLKANRIGLKVLNNIRKGRSNDEYLELVEHTDFVPLEPYKGSTVPILHMCGICDHEWLVRPQHILKPNAKCPVCDLNSRKNDISIVDKVLEEAGLVRLSEYTGAFNDITIKHTCGYTWTTAYSYIQQGSGCPLCNKGFGYDHSKDNMPIVASIYLLHLNSADFSCYKIGVTSRNINTRIIELRKELPAYIKIDVIHTSIDTGIAVLHKEKYILDNFKKYRCSYLFSGHTELLDESVDIELIKRKMNENI